MKDTKTFHDGRIPLARLFAVGFRTLIDALHERLQERGYDDVSRSFGFVLLEARRGPITVVQIAELMGVTKQAASKLVAQMESGRYIKRVVTGVDGRSRPFVLSARGQRLLADVEAIYAELESAWSEPLGKRGLEQLRQALTQVLRDQNGGRLPPVRPT